MLISQKHDKETRARMDFFAYLVIAYVLAGTILMSAICLDWL